ncbi:hypothetical protein LR48_Vigan02g109600 [Vigna angularis]|uniref:Uncharacterized protein n=2 Tax=Phaseolus angularis TaxID=3914 RepID=A0A0L9TWT4_PHAAN|nr:uncharacterized protein HKW66_Vig0251040 [Vigna angularis]KOM34946.1 hypothetical protein LR48_Vigan02g109600 [Vigna angularis]BAT95671.1 hypothetical protein VIGAN_08243200 [Vigna angularis var. angularis]
MGKVKVKKMQKKGEVGGFVVWQKKPELWCLELVVSGYKISAGSDGKVAWRQTPWHHSHASRGPPRPLRRLLQVVVAAGVDIVERVVALDQMNQSKQLHEATSWLA